MLPAGDKPPGARAQLGCTIVDRPTGPVLVWAATIAHGRPDTAPRLFADDVVDAGAIALEREADQC